MKLKIAEETFKEIEIELPFYASDGITYIRADKEINGTAIGLICHHFEAIDVSKIEKGRIMNSWLLYPEITKEEFDEKFNEVLKIIQYEFKY